jgi:hypothetical protein
MNGIDHGFLSDGTNYLSFDDPLGALGTTATGVSGNTVVGWYQDGSGNSRSFVFNTIARPGVISTPEPGGFASLMGISLVGFGIYHRKRKHKETKKREQSV